MRGFKFSNTPWNILALLRIKRKLKSFPLELQVGRDGCGDACAAMLLEAAGLEEMKPKVPKGLKSMGDIWDVLEDAGIACGLYRCPADSLGDQVKTPAVVRLDGCHFAVLWEVAHVGDEAWFILSDPAEGRTLMTYQQFRFRFHEPDGPSEAAQPGGAGYALSVGIQGCCEPSRPTGENLTSWLAGSMRGLLHPEHAKHANGPQKVLGPSGPPGAWAVLGAAGAILLALQWCYPIISKALLDMRLSLKKGHDGIPTAALLLLAQGALMAGRHTFNAAKDLASKRIEEAKRSALDLLLARKVTRGTPRGVPPWSFSPGDLMQLMEDSARLGRVIGRSIPSALLGILGFLGILGAVWVLSAPSSLAFTAGSAITVIWSWRMRSFTEESDRIAQEAFIRYREQASETGLSIWDSRHPRVGSALLSRWEAADKEASSWSVKRHAAWVLMRFGSSVIREGQYLLASYLTAAAAASGDMSIGRLMAVQFAAGQLSVPLETALGSLLEAGEASSGARRLSNISNAEEEEDGESTLPKGPLVFQDVRFRYHRRDVIRGLSLRIEPGEWLLVTGPSGCGKSTLLKLAAGLLMPTEGQVLLGGLELTGRTLRAFRKRVGWVLQESRPLWGSLGWNVSLGKEASEERVLWALEIAGLSDLVVSLPEGLRTPIGPKGVTLSRGETQRLMIARCIYDLPDIVILDEATASLDDATEKRVLSNLMGLPNTPTVIMCSHKKELQHLFHRTICLDSQIGSISSLTQDK